MHTRFITVIILFLICFCGLNAKAWADGQYCIVPVKNGAPTKADLHSTSRMVFQQSYINGLGQPIFHTGLRGGSWTIDNNRSFTSLGSLAPSGFLDFVRQEPWSGRTIISRGYRLNVYSPETRNFIKIETAHINKDFSSSSVSILGKRKQSVTFYRGVPYLIGTTHVEPWAVYNEIKDHNMLQPLIDVYESEALDGLLFTSNKNEIFLWRENEFKKIGVLPKSTTSYKYDLPDTKSLFLLFDDSSILIKVKDDGALTIKTEKFSKKSRDEKHRYKYSEYWNELFRITEDAVEKLTENGFEEIFSLDTAASLRGMVDVPFRRASIFTVGGFLYSYNGRDFGFLKTEDGQVLGDRVKIYVFEALDKVLLITFSGQLYELSENNVPVSVSWPVDVRFDPFASTLIEWPSANAILAVTKDGIFVIDKEFRSQKVFGVDDIYGSDYAEFVTYHENLGEMILKLPTGLFSVVDARVDRSGSCDDLKRRKDQQAIVNICFDPVKGSTPNDMGHFISTLVRSPNGNGILINASNGIYHVNDKNSVRKIYNNDPASSRQAVNIPWSNEVIIDGNILVDEDLNVHDYSTIFDAGSVHLAPSMSTVFITGNRISPKLLKYDEHGQRQFLELQEAISVSEKRVISEVPWKKSFLFDKLRRDDLYTLIDEYANSTKVSIDGYKGYSRIGNHTGKNTILLNELKTILLRMNGWFRLDERLSWEKVEGLDKELFIQDTAFIDAKGYILATTKGLMSIDANMDVQYFDGAFNHSEFKTIRVMGDGLILAGGVDGLFAVDANNMSMKKIQQVGFEEIGAVLELSDSTLFDRTLVRTSLGYFLINNDLKLERLDVPIETKSIFSYENGSLAYLISRSDSRKMDQPMLSRIRFGCANKE